MLVEFWPYRNEHHLLVGQLHKHDTGMNIRPRQLILLQRLVESVRHLQVDKACWSGRLCLFEVRGARQTTKHSCGYS